MPFKRKISNMFLKCIQPHQNSSLPTQNTIDLSQDEQPDRSRITKNKKIKHKNMNRYQLLLSRQPQQRRHVVNFCNIIGINQQALRSENCQQSYLKTLFYLKVVKKVQSRSKYLLFHLVNCSEHTPSIEYIAQRFKSFGDNRFFVVANLILEVAARFKLLQSKQTIKQKQQTSEFISKYTQSLGNSMYVCRISTNKLMISKSLLEILQYDSEEFAIETLKFRTPLHQAASTDNYFDVVVKYFENLRNLLDLISDRISLQTFLDNSVLRFKTHLYTKQNNKIYCKIQTGMPHPLVTIFKIEEIIASTQQFQHHQFYRSKAKELQKVRKTINYSQVNTVRSLMVLPKNFLSQNSHRVADYQQLNDKQ